MLYVIIKVAIMKAIVRLRCSFRYAARQCPDLPSIICPKKEVKPCITKSRKIGICLLRLQSGQTGSLLLPPMPAAAHLARRVACSNEGGWGGHSLQLALPYLTGTALCRQTAVLGQIGRVCIRRICQVSRGPWGTVMGFPLGINNWKKLARWKAGSVSSVVWLMNRLLREALGLQLWLVGMDPRQLLQNSAE